MEITDESMGVSNYWGARVRAVPRVYAYAGPFIHLNIFILLFIHLSATSFFLAVAYHDAYSAYVC